MVSLVCFNGYVGVQVWNRATTRMCFRSLHPGRHTGFKCFYVWLFLVCVFSTSPLICALCKCRSLFTMLWITANFVVILLCTLLRSDQVRPFSTLLFRGINPILPTSRPTAAVLMSSPHRQRPPETTTIPSDSCCQLFSWSRVPTICSRRRGGFDGTASAKHANRFKYDSIPLNSARCSCNRSASDQKRYAGRIILSSAQSGGHCTHVFEPARSFSLIILVPAVDCDCAVIFVWHVLPFGRREQVTDMTSRTMLTLGYRWS